MTETFELSLSRWFDAPPEVVYKAFIDPAQVSQWFGPLAFHVPPDSIDIDARPGGHLNLTMVNNFDANFVSPVSSHLTEVIENQLMVGYEIANGFPGLEDGSKLTMSLEFTAENGGTRLELRQGPLPEDLREQSAIGWGQSFYKLDALLNTPLKWRTAGLESLEEN